MAKVVDCVVPLSGVVWTTSNGSKVVVAVLVVSLVPLSDLIGLGFVLVDEDRSELEEVLVSKFCVDTAANPPLVGEPRIVVLFSLWAWTGLL